MVQQIITGSLLVTALETKILTNLNSGAAPRSKSVDSFVSTVVICELLRCLKKQFFTISRCTFWDPESFKTFKFLI